MVKFLVIRFSSIGDIVLTTPVIRCLKQQVEGAEVHFLTKTSFSDLLSANPYLDRIHLLDGNMQQLVDTLKQEQYDYIIDLQNSLRSVRIRSALRRMYFAVNKLNFRKWLYVNLKINRLPDRHIVDRYLDTTKVFDVRNDLKGLDYFIPEGEVADLTRLPEEFQKGFAAIAIGAQHNTKKMPTEQLAEVCNHLGQPAILLGGPGDDPSAREIMDRSENKQLLNLCGQTTVHRSASYINHSRVVITHDTGMMHIAAALKKPVITIWGNTVPAFGMYPYFPDDASRSFEVSGLSCRPCSKIGFDRCPKKHFRCMMDHNPAEIAAAAGTFF